MVILISILGIGSPLAQVNQQDSLALVAFYNSFNGDNWDNNSGWLTGPVATWYGVYVLNNRVNNISIYDDDNNLTGSYNSGNNLIGNFPPEFSSEQSPLLHNK